MTEHQKVPAKIEPLNGFAHLAELPCLRLALGDATAVISLYGAQLLSYRPDGQTELLYLSPTAEWRNQTPIRGGVPVCWPWFGPAAEGFSQNNPSLPSHGLVRTQLWTVTQQQVDADQVTLSLQLALPAQLCFHQGLSVCLTVVLTLDSLRIELHSPSQPLQQAALHSYFSVQQLDKVQVSPLKGHYLDKVTGCKAEQHSDIVQFEAETDRVYLDTAAELRLITGQYQLQLRQHGHDGSVVWNPWQDKAKRLVDLPDQGYLDFVCVETARLDLKDPSPLCLIQEIRYCPQRE
ncbi:D-hexose-6-phosphate mutarotase [Rheinheimera sp.]|uniref:D-hexose-6-phosphate mutarotase n=1 Tax=Rheinheimera sp. TaxID=1869214 RepID=UPI00307D3E44